MKACWFLPCTLLALPIVLGDDFDAISALADYGVDASNYVEGASHAAYAGEDAAWDEISKRSIGASGCKYSCATLSLIDFGSVAYPNSSVYNLAEANYWSQQQAELEPYCVYQPESSLGVAVALLLSRLTQCPFAVKSGGHAAFASASNIEGGITISLVKLNQVELNENKSVVKVGPGNVWLDVYTALEPYNVTAIGGRVSAIGVGGLTLGGGISFFSGRHGWACDNVANYEVVTASGLIVNANPNSHSDLYYALRGGGNNFGVVTRFDLYTYPQGLMMGGTLVYMIDNSDAILRALISFSEDASTDPDAALIVAYAYAQGQFLAVADLEYAQPELRPAIFEGFQNIPHIQDTTALRTLPNVTVMFNDSNPGGLRETYWTATYKVNFDLLKYLVQEYKTQALSVINATGIGPSFVLQIITTDQLSHMGKYGGNALGLTEEEGPLLLLNIAWWWADPADDQRILQACKNIVDSTVAYAKARGLDNDYLYMNYASQFQNVLPSYNATNHANLDKIAKKYDPTGVFQTLQPGYFKLDEAPATMGQ